MGTQVCASCGGFGEAFYQVLGNNDEYRGSELRLCGSCKGSGFSSVLQAIPATIPDQWLALDAAILAAEGVPKLRKKRGAYRRR